MTPDEFKAGPATILEGAFPGEFTPGDEKAYLFKLAEYDAEDVMRVLKVWRQKWRPAASELQEILDGRSAAHPTFDEMLRLVFGPGGVMLAKPPAPPRADHEALLAAWEAGADWPAAPVGVGITRNGEHRVRLHEARERHAAGLHPLIGSFIDRLGYERLDRDGAALAGNHMDGRGEDTAHWARKELREAWEAHVDAMDGREVAVLAAGTGRDGLRRLDPLAALEPPAHLRALPTVVGSEAS